MAFPSLAYIQTGTVPQRTWRLALGGTMGRPMATFTTSISPTTGGGSHGVVAGGDLAVTVSSGLQLSVAAGACFVNGSSATAQGTYYGYNDAAYAGANVLLTAHDAQPRIDLIIARVRDNAEDAGGSTLFELNKVTGTPAGSPSPPAVPSGSLVLAQVAVPATSGAVTITDKRVYAAALGGLIRCTSTTRPTGAALWIGQTIYEIDKHRTWKYNGTAWLPMSGRFACTVSHTGLSIASVGTATVSWTTENEDTDGFYTSGTNIVIPTGLGGEYTLTAYVFAGTANSSPSTVQINLNGSLTAAGHIPTSGQHATISRATPVNAGDTISLVIFNGHSASVTFAPVVLHIARLSE